MGNSETADANLGKVRQAQYRQSNGVLGDLAVKKMTALVTDLFFACECSSAG
jgi:hypothetical protein